MVIYSRRKKILDLFYFRFYIKCRRRHHRRRRRIAVPTISTNQAIGSMDWYISFTIHLKKIIFSLIVLIVNIIF